MGHILLNYSAAQFTLLISLPNIMTQYATSHKLKWGGFSRQAWPTLSWVETTKGGSIPPQAETVGGKGQFRFVHLAESPFPYDFSKVEAGKKKYFVSVCPLSRKPAP